jgi:hypothetical protein
MQEDEVQRLRREKLEALRDLARARLQPPERDRVLAVLEQGTRAPISAEVVRNAAEKAAQAAADRAEKRKPYEADPLFMYLWRRRFGTGDYKASGLVRSLDRKVAHLVGYEDARVNYAMLMELPERLREHAERLERQMTVAPAVEQHPEIVALLTQAREKPGDESPLVHRIEQLDAALAGSGRSA